MALCYHALGAVLQISGRWPESVRALNESVTLCQEFDGTFGQVMGEQRLAHVETAIGHFQDAHNRLRRILDIARTSTKAMVGSHALGRILATLSLNRYEAGDLEAASEYLAEGFALQNRVGECVSCDVLLYPAAVPIYIAHGALDLSEQCCRKADELASAFGSRSWLATARYLLGLVAMARGDLAAAEAYLANAAATFEAVGQPYDHARALERLALVRSQWPVEGVEGVEQLIERAAKIYAGLGSEFKAQAARRVLTSAG